MFQRSAGVGLNAAHGRPLSASASKQGMRPASRTKKTRWKPPTCICLSLLVRVKMADCRSISLKKEPSF